LTPAFLVPSNSLLLEKKLGELLAGLLNEIIQTGDWGDTNFLQKKGKKGQMDMGFWHFHPQLWGHRHPHSRPQEAVSNSARSS
jgi:hypothetical protein